MPNLCAARPPSCTACKQPADAPYGLCWGSTLPSSALCGILGPPLGPMYTEFTESHCTPCWSVAQWWWSVFATHQNDFAVSILRGGEAVQITMIFSPCAATTQKKSATCRYTSDRPRHSGRGWLGRTRQKGRCANRKARRNMDIRRAARQRTTSVCAGGHRALAKIVVDIWLSTLPPGTLRSFFNVLRRTMPIDCDFRVGWPGVKPSLCHACLRSLLDGADELMWGVHLVWPKLLSKSFPIVPTQIWKHAGGFLYLKIRMFDA